MKIENQMKKLFPKITPKDHKCDISKSYGACPCGFGGSCMDNQGGDRMWLVCSEPGCKTVFKKD